MSRTLDLRRGCKVFQNFLKQGDHLLGSRYRHLKEGGPGGNLCFGLHAAKDHECLRGNAQQHAGSVLDRALNTPVRGDLKVGGGRPCSLVDAAFAIPAPHLFGHEGQVGSKQTNESIDGDRQRCAGRSRSLITPLALAVVGAFLHELQVVIAEGPEEGLGDFQCTRVLVVFQSGGRRGDNLTQSSKHRTVEGLDNVRDIQIQICVSTHRESELRSVEHLDG